jgi:hypothetical protein
MLHFLNIFILCKSQKVSFSFFLFEASKSHLVLFSLHAFVKLNGLLRPNTVGPMLSNETGVEYLAANPP